MSNISDKNGLDGNGLDGNGSDGNGSDRKGRHDMDDFEIMDERHARLVARALGELEGADLAAVEAELAASPEARAELARIQATLGLVEEALADAPRLSDASRAALGAMVAHEKRSDGRGRRGLGGRRAGLVAPLPSGHCGARIGAARIGAARIGATRIGATRIGFVARHALARVGRGGLER
jgi:anti-sigma factor RsiW